MIMYPRNHKGIVQWDSREVVVFIRINLPLRLFRTS